MYQSNKWWLGLALPVILWGAANVLSNDRIEQDLTLKAMARIAWAKPTLAGRDATMSGMAQSEEAKAKAAATIDAITGIRKVNTEALYVLAEVKPYKWQAVKESNKLTFTGYFPDEKTHQDILGAAKKSLPNAQIADEMKLARGAPASFELAAIFGLSQLGNLSAGVASLDDLKYSITGTAQTSASYISESAKVKALPQGVILTTAAILPPVQKPYSWSAQREGNSITLSGFVPSDTARLKNIEAAKVTFPNTTINDNQSIAAGEPVGFEQMASYAISQLGKLTKGSAKLEDKTYSLIGDAANVQASDLALAATKMLPVGFTLGKAVITTPTPTTPVTPEAPTQQVTTPTTIAPPAMVPEIINNQVDICRNEFKQELNESSIYFDTDKDTLRQVSFAVLDRLVEVAKKCPDVQVEIGAHTDSGGTPSHNQDLSERRAKAVLDYMKVRVDTTRYTSTGYGETKPIASNETDEDKQKNRRVEFNVK